MALRFADWRCVSSCWSRHAVLRALTGASILLLGHAAAHANDALLSAELKEAFTRGRYEKVIDLGMDPYRGLASRHLQDPALRRFGLQVSATGACGAEAAEILRSWAGPSKNGDGEPTERDISRVVRRLYRKYRPYRSALQGEVTALPEDAVEFLVCMKAAFRRQDDRTLFGMRDEVLPRVPKSAYDQLVTAYLRATRSINELEGDRRALTGEYAAKLTRRAQFEEALLETEEVLGRAAELMEENRFEEVRQLGRKALLDFTRARVVYQDGPAERRHEDAKRILEVLGSVLGSFLRELPEDRGEVGFFRFRSWVAEGFSGGLADLADVAMAKEYYRRAEYDKARSEIEDFRKVHPESELAAGMTVLEALVDIREDRLSQATAKLLAAVEAEPGDPEVAGNARFLLGYCHLLQGSKGEAVTAFTGLIAEFPSTPQAARAQQLLDRLLPTGAAGL